MTDKTDGVLAMLDMAIGGGESARITIHLTRAKQIRDRVAELLAADEEYDAATDAFRDSTQSREADRFSAAMKRRAAALRAMRGQPPVG